MKKTLCRLIIAASLPVIIQTVSASVLLTDNFMVSSNSQNVNQELATRQTGPLAPATYLLLQEHHQVGNTTTDVGQPGGAANGNFVLLAFDGAFASDVDVAAVATGPVTIEFDMYLRGANPGGASDDSWVAFGLRSPNRDNNGYMFPVCGAGEFGFLVRARGGIQAFQNGEIDGQIPGGLDIPGTAMADHWTLTFSDPFGTGSAFNGNGSQVTLVNGTTTLGTLSLGQLNSRSLRAGFRDAGNRFGGISNLKISGTLAVLTPPGHNLSFEYDTTMPGTAWNFVPTSWTGFNGEWTDYCGPQYPSGADFTASADGNQFFFLNNDRSGVESGIYQDMGAFQSNTIYSLTVAIGSRADMTCTPGIIKLVNGTDNTGTVLATGGGLPDTQNTWQDYTINFTNGPSASGDLTIVLSALGAGTIQADFDNVRLTTAPAPAVIPPSLLTDVHPLESRVTTGTPMSFSVTANGSLPLHYQWFTQSGPISGATGSSYSFNAVAGTNGYYVSVTNSGGAANSSTAVVISDTNIVTVNNFSFENGSVSGPGGGTLPVSWTQAGFVNWCAVSAGSYSTIPDGTDFFALNEGPADPTGGIYQDVGALLPNTIYTLTVALGRNPGFGPGSGLGSPGIISLLNGTDNTGTLLASTNGIPDTAGDWQDYTVSFTNGALASGQLTIALTVAGASTYQANFDNVRLTIAPAPAVIPPSILIDVHPLQSRVTTGTPMSFAVTANGSLPLSYQWYNQNGPISGATNSSYSFNAVAGTNSYYVGVSNSANAIVSSTAEVISDPSIVTVNNFSFENGTVSGPGGGTLPVSWAQAGSVNWCSVILGGGYATVPDGSNLFALNEGPSDSTGGIYQDVGALLANTTYTLTVAIGHNPGFQNSPGIISLLNSTDNTGTLLASTSGIPDTAGDWQDYTATFTTGASVSGHLTVELTVAPASTWQANFDDVRLTKTVVPVINPPKVSGGNLILTGTVGSPGAGYVLLTTTNLSAPIVWTTNTTGTLDSAGAFSNAVPIGSAPARFYRVNVP